MEEDPNWNSSLFLFLSCSLCGGRHLVLVVWDWVIRVAHN